MKEDTIIPPCHLVDLIIVCVNTQGGVLSNFPYARPRQPGAGRLNASIT